MEFPISRMVDSEWRGVKLTDEQRLKWNTYVGEITIHGQNLEDYLNSFIQTQAYRSLKSSAGITDPGTKGAVITRIIRAYRKAAFDKLDREEGRTLSKQLQENRMNLPDDRLPPSDSNLGFEAYIRKAQPGGGP
jgi:hypothetical protein